MAKASCHQQIIATVGGTEEGWEAAEPAKKRRDVGREEALPIVGNNPSFLKWEGLSSQKQMQYGTRWHTKGVSQIKEELVTHIFNTLTANGKWQRGGGG